MLFGWKRHGVGRFSKEGEAALALAREEAIRFNNDYVGAEHLLLGLLRQSNPGTTRLLQPAGVSNYALQSQLQNVLCHGKEPVGTEIRLASRVTKILRIATREAMASGQGDIEPEHLLRGIIIEGHSIAARLLSLSGLKSK